MKRRDFLGLLATGAITRVLPSAPVTEGLAFRKDAFAIAMEPLLRKGDIITIAGKFAVNPITRQLAVNPETGEPFLRHFVITADAMNDDDEILLHPDPKQVISPAMARPIGTWQ